MSEVQTRPSAPRGRSSARGGRASFGSRGGRGGRNHTTNGDKAENTAPTSIEDEGEVGQLKKKYGSKVATIKELFPNWTDEDAVFALQETDGDLETAVGRITDGTITQWGEVSKTKKDRSRSKAKDAVTTTLSEATNGPRVSRGVRGAQEGGRGGRGRGTERGRGGRGRGGVPAHTNGTRTKEASDLSVPTEESSAWDPTPKDHDNSESLEAAKPADSWGAAAAEAASTTATTAAKITSGVIPGGVKKSWASMFKPTPAPAPKKDPSPVQKTPVASVPEPIEAEPEPVQPEPEVSVPHPEPEMSQEPEDPTPTEPPSFQEAEVSITPSKDELTETNLEQVLDTSNPAPTATQASTAASSWDPRSGATSSTPYSALQQSQQQAIRPPTSGFVASALKATGGSGRSASYQRRLLDQEEAVRMPGNREVDRAAVQFGAFNLNGTGDEDVDGDREEPETRAQPPQHSPVAHPRASLPPAPTQSTGLPERVPSSPTLKEAPGLPATTHPIAAPGLPSPNTQPGAQNMSQQGSQGSQQYNQYGRYQQTGGQDPSTFGQKPYDPFSHQAPSAQTQFEGYPSQQTPSQSQQQQSQGLSATFSSAPSEYSSYYTADQQRNAYQNYYGHQYNQQQSGQAQQDGPASQQRSFSGYNAPQADSTTSFPQTSAQQSQSRYATAGEPQTSGHSTPNPTAQTQQPGQTAPGQQAHPTQPQGQPGQYPYGHPYYTSPYYAAYMNQQYQQGYGQGNYAAGPYGAKAGMYNQPHQGYGISPQTPYDHTASSPAGGFGQSSLQGRDSALGGGLGDYGRAGSQPSQAAQPLGGSGPFGGMDTFGRGSSYQGQGSHFGQQGNQPGSGDELKPYGEGKSTNGPSPLLSQAARPGSAANSAPGQSVLPQPQSSQQGYGGYPSQLQQQHALHGSQAGSPYGGLGGVGGHQAAGQGHQSSQYGGYGQAFGGNSYYGNNQQRGGWGNNYGH